MLQIEEKHQVMAPQLDQSKSPVQRLEAKRKKNREAPLPVRSPEGRGPSTPKPSRRSLEHGRRIIPFTK
ncbi:hypothetical protein SLE2022_318550 [Rubroshorea leprosula]